MRKDALMIFIENNSDEMGVLGKHPLVQVFNLLKEFLKEEAIANLSEHEEVDFSAFKACIKRKNRELLLQALDITPEQVLPNQWLERLMELSFLTAFISLMLSTTSIAIILAGLGSISAIALSVAVALPLLSLLVGITAKIVYAYQNTKSEKLLFFLDFFKHFKEAVKLDTDLVEIKKEKTANKLGLLNVATKASSDPFEAQAVMRSLVNSFLDNKDVCAFFSVSKKYYYVGISSGIWCDRLLQIGFRTELLQELIKTKAVKNYKNLYRAASRSFMFILHNPECWELLCLSGDPSAFNYATSHYQLKNKGRVGFFVGISGIPTVVEKWINSGMDILDSDSSTSLSWIERGVCLSGVPRQLKRVFNLKNPKLDFTRKGGNGYSGDYALLSGVPAQAEEAKRLGIKFSSFFGIAFAAHSGIFAQLKWLSKQGYSLEPLAQHAFIISGGSINPKLPQTIFKSWPARVNPKNKVNGYSLLHSAVAHGYLPQIKQALSYGLDPRDIADDGYSAYTYAKKLPPHLSEPIQKLLDEAVAKIESDKHAALVNVS